MNVIIRKFSTFLKTPHIVIEKIIIAARPLLPETLYLRLLFRYRLGYALDLRHPKSFSEKLQWLKLFDHRPEYTTMVDKYLVKDYVAKLIGAEYIIPTIGVWDSVEEIEWSKLPEKFVLKSTNGGGGGGVIICYNKNELNRSIALKNLKKSLKQNIYKKFREWPYKDVKSCIIAEKLLPVADGAVPCDYKFYCFNGVPKAVLIATERFSSVHAYFDYFDLEGNLLPFNQGGNNNPNTPQFPSNIEEMKVLAAKLSQGIPHVRVDLYCVNNRVYFGEMTFFDSSGFARFEPREWDYTFGSWITLPPKRI